MQTSEQTICNISLSSILCMSYTLDENNNIFKKLNLKNENYLNIRDGVQLSNKLYNFQEFYSLLNKSSLRRFAYKLINPLLIKNYLLYPCNIEDKIVAKNVCAETILLKKYLRKFKHNYRNYFFYKNGNFNNVPTEKEMNTSAIKYLFLLTGI